jgi:hypothetical protein
MSIVKKAAVKGKTNSDIIVVEQMRSYADEPYFVEKAEKAKAFLKEHPIPDWIVNKDRSK